MECAINEWASGIKADISFSAADYRSIHVSHLKCLQDFDAATKKHDLLIKISSKMYNVGRWVHVHHHLIFSPSLTLSAGFILVLSRSPLPLLQPSQPPPSLPPCRSMRTSLLLRLMVKTGACLNYLIHCYKCFTGPKAGPQLINFRYFWCDTGCAGCLQCAMTHYSTMILQDCIHPMPCYSNYGVYDVIHCL